MEGDDLPSYNAVDPGGYFVAWKGRSSSFTPFPHIAKYVGHVTTS